MRHAFDPVVSVYGFSLTPQPPADHVEQRRAAAVYETTPAEFTRRFARWATQWDFGDAGCVDLWIEADLATNRVDVHLEGERIRELADGLIANGATAVTEAETHLEDALEDEARLCAAVLGALAEV